MAPVNLFHLKQVRHTRFRPNFEPSSARQQVPRFSASFVRSRIVLDSGPGDFTDLVARLAGHYFGRRVRGVVDTVNNAFGYGFGRRLEPDYMEQDPGLRRLRGFRGHGRAYALSLDTPILCFGRGLMAALGHKQTLG